VTDHARLIAELEKPGALPEGRSAESRLETHISTLLFTEHRVYKIKKPVELAFLDFSTLERRRFFSELEVKLNQALAPGVYLAVLPITREGKGRVSIGGAGEPVDCAIEMIRLPADRMLPVLLERDEVTDADVDGIAARLGAFHRNAAAGPDVDAHASPEAIHKRLFDNLDECRPFVGDPTDSQDPASPTLDPAIERHLREWSAHFIDTNAHELTGRVAESRIRDGHGDLHAGNICMTTAPDGRARPVVYDRLEFARALRCQDVAAEIAFLAMDLDKRGHPELAGALTAAYADATNDPGVKPLQPSYRAHFAVVRGKVQSIAAREAAEDDGDQGERWSEAVEYFALAAGYTLPPSLVLMCGLPATGKSTLAKRLAVPLRAEVLRSDVIRKELAGLDPADRPGSDLYTTEWTTRTYGELRTRADDALRRGRHVIADANFPTREMRDRFAALARDLDSPFAIVHATADDETIRARMRARARDAAEPSDADFDVYLDLKARFESPGDHEQPVHAPTELHPTGAATRLITRLIP